MSFDNNNVRQFIELAESLCNGKDYLVGHVIDRLGRAANSVPHNQIIRTMESVFRKRASTHGLSSIVSQKEIQNVFDNVAGFGNTREAREFIEDLLLSQSAGDAAANHTNEAHVAAYRDSDTKWDMVDPNKVAEYSGIFQADPGNNVIKKAHLENGRKAIESELCALGFGRPQVALSANDENFVVYAAELDTRNGKMSFLIPCEIKLGSAVMPSFFVSGSGFVDLTAENIRSHVSARHNISKSASPKAVIDTLNRIFKKESTGSSLQKSASVDDKIHFYTPEYFNHYAVSRADATESLPIEEKAPVPMMPKPLLGLTEGVINETLVEAGLSHPRETVLRAKAVLANELRVAGLRFDQVSVQSEFDHGIILSAIVSGKGGSKKIEVPLEIKGSKVFMPTQFISGTFADKFTEECLRSFANKEESVGEFIDPKLHDKYDCSFVELHKMALNKAAFGDFIEATEALSVIHDKFGPALYSVAHNDLLSLLRAGYGKEEKPISAIDRFVSEASRKAADKENHIKINSTAMLFYPKE